jgi:MFS transporter, DHA1 family, tetracycline resistance protein
MARSGIDAFAVWPGAPETLVGGNTVLPPTKVSPRQAEPGSEVCGPAADTSPS